MASSLFALLDDIATMLDDVSIAAKKTAGVLGDDLALNANQVAGVKPDRELPVVWAVAKGSLLNKAILVPAAILISQFAPWAIVPLLICGGLFLCYEGVEKLAHKFFHSADDAAHEAAVHAAATNEAIDLVALEKDKIKGAVRTDFVLSAEIIVISLGVVATKGLASQIGVLVGISLIMTIGVYGLVAGIVKLDDAGLALSRRPNPGTQRFGRMIVRGAPYLMKLLSVVGTIAMFLVGGGIITHNVHAVHEWVATHLVTGTGALATLAGTGVDFVVGVIAGALVLALVKGGTGLFRAVLGKRVVDKA